MAGMSEWVKALGNIGLHSEYNLRSTVDTYKRIESLGLPGIKFESFATSKESELIRVAKNFIPKNRPCLFIWDPIESKNSLKKDYRTDLEDFSFIEFWALQNRQNLGNYNYLLTDQVGGDESSFVGTAYSNGKGDIFCETLHFPFVYNHRDLSNRGTADSSNTDLFLAGDFSFEGSVRGLVTRRIVRSIIELYGDKIGSFEFIYGNKRDERGVYTTGLENLDFPRELYERSFLSIRGR